MTRPTRRGATTAQLRDDIDRGRTGDKVNFSDPAAAPLGTDEEAAGTPPHPDTVAAAREMERHLTEEPPALPWSVKLTGIALAGLALVLLFVALT